MLNIFRKTDEYENILIKQCPSCHGFIKSSDTKCKHCGGSTQLKHKTPIIKKETQKETGRFSDDQPDFESGKFSM